MDHPGLNDLELTSLHKGKIQVRLARKWRSCRMNSLIPPCVCIIPIDQYLSCEITIYWFLLPFVELIFNMLICFIYTKRFHEVQQQRMHGCISSSLVNIFEEQLILGQNYELSNFQVVPFRQRYKCFQCTLQIILTIETKFHKLSKNNFDIPQNIFEFTDLY